MFSFKPSAISVSSPSGSFPAKRALRLATLLSEDCGPLTVDPRDSLRSIIGLCVLSIYILGATKQRDVGEIKILSHENSILSSAIRKNTLISCASKLLFYHIRGIEIVLAKERKRSFGKIFIELELSFKAESELALL